MLRVVGLVMLSAGFLPEGLAARNLRRPTHSVAPQVLLSTDASNAKKTQDSAVLKAKTGIAQFFYPHFLLRLMSTKTVKGAQPPPGDGLDDTVADEGAGGSGTTRMMVQLFFGVIYYFIIVRKYPELGAKEPSTSAKDLLQKNAVMALADDAEALDLTSDVQTGFFSVYEKEAKKEGEEGPAEEAPAEAVKA